MEAVFTKDPPETTKEFGLKKQEKILLIYSQEMIFLLILTTTFLEKLKEESERRTDGDGYPSNIFVNPDITLQEVRTAIDQAKVKKAAGVEEIPK